MSNFKENLSRIKAFAFDVDGVFSNGNIYLLPDGDVIRSMNIKDGYAIQFAVKMNYPIAIITGALSATVERRFASLGVKDIYLKSKNKIADFNDFVKKNQLDPSEVLYMGDDIPDFEIMQKVGFPTCPADAAEEIKQLSLYISHKKGGEGCVRDVLEQVLKVHGHWMGPQALG
jgi:3-deoxy-D-manno-octulosonate 8-phosphate phosphatase (KDO 8-P phosphatase)